MSTNPKKLLLAASLLFLSLSQAHAGADAIRTKAFFNAISGGNAETIASFYADNAEFHWVGGPLAGVYKGRSAIGAAWSKFSKAAGKTGHEVVKLSESRNGRISTVTATVKFLGEKKVPVRFTLMFENGQIVNQIWELDKTASYKPKAAPAPTEKAQDTEDQASDKDGTPPVTTAAIPAQNANDAPEADEQRQVKAEPAPAADNPAAAIPVPTAAKAVVDRTKVAKTERKKRVVIRKRRKHRDYYDHHDDWYDHRGYGYGRGYRHSYGGHGYGY